MERRDFLKSSCKACLLGASGVLLSQLVACTPAAYTVYKTEVTDRKLSVPLSLFDKGPLQFVRPRGWYYDIAVQKNENNEYTALLMQCSHQENQLTPSANGFHCTMHGSDFAKDGSVKKGPAELPLKQYKTSLQNGFLIIETV